MSIMAVISDFYNSQMPRHRRISKNSNNKKGPFNGLFLFAGRVAIEKAVHLWYNKKEE